MKEAVNAADLDRLKMLSHKLKGASANLRFAKLSVFFSAIEEKSFSGEEEFDYSEVIDDIIDEIAGLKTYVRGGE